MAVQWGLHIPITQLGTETHASHIAVATSVGAKVARINFNWKTIEPTQGNFTWTTYHDQAVASLVAAGIEPLGVLLGSPQWANGSSDEWVVPGEGTDSTYLTWEGHYIDFCEAVVARYKDVIQMWEVWNEWNDEYFWKPAADQAQYFHLYPATRTAVLAVDANAKVAVGGFTPTTGGGGVWMKDWMPAMYAADIYPDYIAIHAYTGGNRAPWDDAGMYEANFGDIQRCRDYQLAEGGAAVVPIWVTEWGWESDSVGEQNQADYTAWSMRTIRDDYNYVTVATLFADVDGGGVDQYGIYNGSSYIATTPKPAAFAFQSIAYTPDTTPQIAAPPSYNRPLIKIDGAGLLERAKRRQDFCRVWVDGDYGQWYDSENGDHSPAWAISRAGELKFTCAAGSVMTAYTAPGVQWYWLHKGLSDEQSIATWEFDWTSYGTASWYAYCHPGGDISTGWTSLGSGGGATQATATAVSYDLSGAVYRYLNISVYYTVGKTLTADEWVRFSPLRVYGQSGDMTIIDVLDDIFIADGLATSARDA